MPQPEPAVALETFAAGLCRTPVLPDVVQRHVLDTAAAFLVGFRTSEGQALARFYAGSGRPEERAAAVAAIARLSECDDIHLSSCITPGAAVVPVALMSAEGARPDAVAQAIAAGCAAGLALGTAIDGIEALRNGVWPTLLAAPAMAAVTTSLMRGHEPAMTAHAIALALAGASGIAGRPGGTPSGRWFHFAEAVMKGVRAARAAEAGFRGPLMVLSKDWLEHQARHGTVAMDAFQSPPSIADVGFKPFAVARQALNAVLAFQLLGREGFDGARWEAADIEVHVGRRHHGLLTRPLSEHNRLSRLSHLGYQIACAALAPDLLNDACRPLEPRLMALASRVSVQPSDEFDAKDRWGARIGIRAGGTMLSRTMIASPFDHDAPGLAERLRRKWHRLLPAHDVMALREAESSSEKAHAALWQMLEGRVSMAAERG